MVTDYDSGLVAEGAVKPVSVEEIILGFKQNMENVKKLILEIIQNWPEKRSCDCRETLKQARF